MPLLVPKMKQISRNRSLLIFFMLLAPTTSCTHATFERATTVTIVDDSNPPTFKLDGNGYQMFFLVEEVSAENHVGCAFQDPRKNTHLWHITPKEETRSEVWLWPKITYGKVPDGFVQKTPNADKPPPLLEG